MNREEMLKHLGLNEDQLRDLLEKFEKFYRSLDKPQRATVARSLPLLEEAARTFGPNVNARLLQELLSTLGPDDGSAGVAVFEGINTLQNPGS